MHCVGPQCNNEQVILHAKLHRSPVDSQLSHYSSPSLNGITFRYDSVIIYDPKHLRTWSILKVCKWLQNCRDVYSTLPMVLNAFLF